MLQPLLRLVALIVVALQDVSSNDLADSFEFEKATPGVQSSTYVEHGFDATPKHTRLLAQVHQS